MENSTNRDPDKPLECETIRNKDTFVQLEAREINLTVPTLYLISCLTKETSIRHIEL